MRIISGEARGRRFDAPSGQETRPTTDRIKESMFSILQFDVVDSVVLDLFSGSGSLGFEAISRGAKLAYLNDQSTECVQLIQRNAARLKFDTRVIVSESPFDICLKRLAEKGVHFDLIFLDPPYDAGLEQEAIQLIKAYDLLAKEGKIIVEHQQQTAPPDFLYAGEYDTRRYGSICVTIFQREDS